MKHLERRVNKANAIAVVGLGYVGLPLAVGLAKHREVLGFDVNPERIAELQTGKDRNLDVDAKALKQRNLQLTTDPRKLDACDAFLIAVPTPVDKRKRPDFTFLLGASRIVGEALARRKTSRPKAAPAIVVFESTVYPGCTEDVCAPAIEQASGLKARTGFRLGYSPERINPGDKQHTLETIVKIVSGQDARTLDDVAAIYEQVVKAGVYRAPDIRTAEAAKVIENTQRDLNIALMNEFAMLFHKLGLDTQEVLKAAGTKWNFLPFRPGLVGGHCIPEDPYYLTYKAEEVGYDPRLILAGRRVNDDMGRYVARETVKLLIQSGFAVNGARVQVLGVTFKEDVPDTRNTRVVDLVRELEEFGCDVVVHDPLVGDEGIKRLGLKVGRVKGAKAAAVVVAVPHKELLRAKPWVRILAKNGVLVDVKGRISPSDIPAGVADWRL